MAKIKTSKKKQQYVPTCIFCKSAPVTEEHLFPQWVEKEFPKGKDNKHIVNNYDPLTYGRTKFSSKTVNRNIVRITVKRLCVSCNTGWMSAIENNSKEIIKSLILDEPVMLGPEEQDRLVKWGVLKAIIGEFADRDSRDKIAISKEERLRFFEVNDPSSNFTVWLGRNSATEGMWKDPSYIHYTAYLNPQHLEFVATPRPNVQWSLFVITTFVLITFWNEKQCDLILPPLIADKLVQIHPLINSSLNYRAIPALSQNEMEYIRTNLNTDSLGAIDK